MHTTSLASTMVELTKTYSSDPVAPWNFPVPPVMLFVVPWQVNLEVKDEEGSARECQRITERPSSTELRYDRAALSYDMTYAI
jgi:hypothetical protein